MTRAPLEDRGESERRRLRARWVFPVDSEPIENGVVEIERGRITAVHGRGDARAEDLGNVALVPSLVNAHTHLEFSELPRPLEPAQPFTDWIRTLVAHRHRRGVDTTECVRLGARECWQTGCVTIGEIATDETTADVLAEEPLRAVIFRELLGLSPERMASQMEAARRHLESPASPKVIRGLSPHAPYSVHPELFRELVELAGAWRAPVAMHLAETQAELELLAHGTGEFVDMLREFGVWTPDAIPRGSRPLDYLEPLSTVECGLVVHGNYLSNDEIDFLADHRHLAVVYCPRTHAWFGHEPHPWRALLDRGASVAIGTDSRASNPDLSIWNELLFLRRQFPEMSPRLLLELATIRGARALGLAEQTGTLTPGKCADLAVIDLSGAPSGGDPHSLLLNPRSKPIRTSTGPP